MDKKKIKEIFNQLDLDGNGTIDEEEFVLGMKKLVGVFEDFDEDFKVIFKMIDKSGLFHKSDGKLTLKEFTRVAKALPETFSSDKVREVGKILFKIIDADNSGEVSKKELSAFINTMEKRTEEEINNFWRAVDSDGNGKVSMEEFLGWYCC